MADAAVAALRSFHQGKVDRRFIEAKVGIVLADFTWRLPEQRGIKTQAVFK